MVPQIAKTFFDKAFFMFDVVTENKQTYKLNNRNRPYDTILKKKGIPNLKKRHIECLFLFKKIYQVHLFI